jgi:hypothetical protein
MKKIFFSFNVRKKKNKNIFLSFIRECKNFYRVYFKKVIDDGKLKEKKKDENKE